MEFRSWKWVLKYYMLLMLCFIVAVVFLFYFFHILPPQNTSIASGQYDSSTFRMAESFRQTFLSNNLNLNIVPGEGRQEGFFRLEDKASPVNATFYVAGHISADDHPDIVSLGSVQSAPLWLFYRGTEFETDDPMTAFKGKK